MSTQTLSDAELAELVEAEIPCGGVFDGRKGCGRPAVLRRHGHGHPIGPQSFKCIACWQVWYSACASLLARHGSIRCGRCGQEFGSVESFSDYRPF